MAVSGNMRVNGQDVRDVRAPETPANNIDTVLKSKVEGGERFRKADTQGIGVATGGSGRGPISLHCDAVGKARETLVADAKKAPKTPAAVQKSVENTTANDLKKAVIAGDQQKIDDSLSKITDEITAAKSLRDKEPLLAWQQMQALMKTYSAVLNDLYTSDPDLKTNSTFSGIRAAINGFDNFPLQLLHGGELLKLAQDPKTSKDADALMTPVLAHPVLDRDRFKLIAEVLDQLGEGKTQSALLSFVSGDDPSNALAAAWVLADRGNGDPNVMSVIRESLAEVAPDQISFSYAADLQHYSELASGSEGAFIEERWKLTVPRLFPLEDNMSLQWVSSEHPPRTLPILDSIARYAPVEKVPELVKFMKAQATEKTQLSPLDVLKSRVDISPQIKNAVILAHSKVSGTLSQEDITSLATYAWGPSSLSDPAALIRVANFIQKEGSPDLKSFLAAIILNPNQTLVVREMGIEVWGMKFKTEPSELKRQLKDKLKEGGTSDPEKRKLKDLLDRF